MSVPSAYQPASVFFWQHNLIENGSHQGGDRLKTGLVYFYAIEEA